MKTDNQLQRDVMAELEWEPSVTHSDIGVSVKDGVVALSGFVPNYAEKLAAEKATRRVSGVHAIAEEIKVRYPFEPKTSDSEVARRILDIFSWDAVIPNDKINVKVEKGWVTLSGSVDWRFQADAARRAAGKIHGVVGVSDLIEVHKLPAASDVRERIVAAFKRSADVDSGTITVFTEGNKVILNGKVHGWHERNVAENAAWAAPGVTKVEDNLVVTA